MLKLKQTWIKWVLIACSATLEARCQDTCLTVPEIKGIAYQLKIGDECEKIRTHNDSVNSEIISLQAMKVIGLKEQNRKCMDLNGEMSDRLGMMDKNLNKANKEAKFFSKTTGVEAIIILILSIIVFK